MLSFMLWMCFLTELCILCALDKTTLELSINKSHSYIRSSFLIKVAVFCRAFCFDVRSENSWKVTKMRGNKETLIIFPNVLRQI